MFDESTVGGEIMSKMRISAISAAVDAASQNCQNANKEQLAGTEGSWTGMTQLLF
jgi:hypothetical protein